MQFSTSLCSNQRAEIGQSYSIYLLEQINYKRILIQENKNVYYSTAWYVGLEVCYIYKTGQKSDLDIISVLFQDNNQQKYSLSNSQHSCFFVKLNHFKFPLRITDLPLAKHLENFVEETPR